ncbi:cellobiose transport system permease protein [Streptomyces sp. DvalAA-14]|uniref:carbohydrate ABC transporter permease n=1 Tax=unclassified Streptomyces TaxID=2593676 RepID=UPI00081B47AB|nr:sugar ABC transporter permease [Streptomyces sp. DvalAA-14]MYS22940.1 ABC transporter permease subunit [Streptomyces sp. SID4948]SCE24910.1 cellobiose transport system permease protein [Streptomyces sp. DvalAA-14]
MATSVRAASDGRAPAGWRSKLYRLDTKASPYAYIAPFFLCFAAFGLFPLIYTGWLSLNQVQLGTTAHWVGLKNYTELWKNQFFWTALRNTFTLGVISTVPQLMMALGLAHLLNYQLKARGFFRVAVLAPYATSIAAASLVFVQLFNPDYGMINQLLGHLGVDPVQWSSSKWPAQIAISSIVTWRWTGYNALIYLAAMQAVPADLYEAAALDGASRWRQFISVTIPSIRPTIFFTIIVSTIGATQLFGEPLIYGGNSASGGSAHQYQTLSLYMYDKGWQIGELGQASAVAWVMLLILLLIGAVQLFVLRRNNRRKLGG